MAEIFNRGLWEKKLFFFFSPLFRGRGRRPMHRAKERDPPSRGGVWENWQMVLNARLTKKTIAASEGGEFSRPRAGESLSKKRARKKKVEQEGKSSFSLLSVAHVAEGPDRQLSVAPAHPHVLGECLTLISVWAIGSQALFLALPKTLSLRQSANYAAGHLRHTTTHTRVVTD